MTPDQALASHRQFINEIGEDIIVRRWSGPSGSRTHVDITTRARVMAYQPREISGSISVGDQKVIALVDTLGSLLPLTNADKLVVRGRELAIKAIDDNTRRIAGILIALEIQAVG